MKLRNAVGTGLVIGALALPVYAADVEVQINAAPPPPVKVEVSPPAPRTGYIYEPGHYNWDGQKYQWQDSRYIEARPGRTYTPTTVEKKGDVWIYKKGGWDDGK